MPTGRPLGNCLEVGDGHPGIVPVRDSKVAEGPTLVFRAAAWTSFVADLKNAWPPRPRLRPRPLAGPWQRCPGAPRHAGPGPAARQG
ncbi:DUF397 domain-containing protein [Streptomyces sp. NBC_00984]|uniref:DUF397 domain-containing protein n=1 Tax=Streptomyces sp. NBC_00984 TaxID=2903700 RepID=UPI003868FD97